MLFARGWRQRPSVALLVLVSVAPLIHAHEHHETGPPDESVPIDWIMWLHIVIQSLAWFLLFPLATVFGLTRHRLHVPTAVTGLVLTSAGFVMGHKHGGRRFPHTAHGSVANLLIPVLFMQGVLGFYLKLHLKWAGEAKFRPIVLMAHGTLGKAFAVLGWLQMVLGVITLRGWCMGGATGQCLAHHIMGSAFIGYGVILLIMLKAGVDWLKRRNMSQEMLESAIIFCWGWVNALTEHRGGRWTHKDLQHTMLGVVWIGGGAAGLWVSRNGKRSVFPSICIVMTGWVMSGHTQKLMLSTHIHALFGYTLLGVGAGRIIEVCFLLKDRPTGEEQADDQVLPPGQWYPIRAFQYLPIWFLFASGAILMSATDDELHWAAGKGIDQITWGLMDFTFSFIIFLWANVLIDFYTGQGGRYGSRYAATAAATPGGMGADAVETGRGGAALYNRLSLDDSSGEEHTAVESRTNSNDSIEMERVKTKKRSAPPSYRAPSPNHVIFNQEEEEDDPFDDHR